MNQIISLDNDLKMHGIVDKNTILYINITCSSYVRYKSKVKIYYNILSG